MAPIDKERTVSLPSPEILATFPCFADLKAEFEKEDAPLVASLPKGATIFTEGDPCTRLAFLLSGSVRVFKMAESGREMTLYRIQSGESCILSISSLLSNNPRSAIAVVEEDSQAVIVSERMFLNWMKDSPCIQKFVFELLARSLSSILTIVEEVAFRRVDERIIRYLLEHAGSGAEVSSTHQVIATEIGTSREVVSRTLKELEIQGLLHLKRGVVELAQKDLLQNRLV